MKRGHLNEEEIRYSSELLCACTHVREGVAGGNGPLGWVTGRRQHDWWLKAGKGFCPFPFHESPR